MGKTFKDKANHFAHHLKHSEEEDKYYAKKNKLKYTEADIPDDVKDMIPHNTSERYGNHRKMYAKMKVDERHSQKAKDKEQFRKDLRDE